MLNSTNIGAYGNKLTTNNIQLLKNSSGKSHTPYSFFYEMKSVVFSRALWESNLKIVNDHNLKADLGVHTYWLGMNAYADMVNIQFEKIIFINFSF